MAQVFQNILTAAEIQSIVDFYADRPDAATQDYVVNKNLEYHIPEDFIYQLLNPKLNDLLGEHEFDNGAYKECMKPYPLHVDTHYAHEQLETMTTFGSKQRHNIAVLIPLVEGPQFRTVAFNCYAEDNNWYTEIDAWRSERNCLRRDDYRASDDRTFDMLAHLPVDIDYEWRLGDVLTWQRNQLHVSADFASHGLVKKFLVLFIA
jgi:hypothetical protein